MPFRLALLLALLFATAVIVGRAQEPGAATPGDDEPATQQAPVFRTKSDLVVMHVNVFDGRSDAVPNLPRQAFQVIEDGATRDITFFNSEDVPVAVGLVIDNSTSMLTRRSMLVAGGKAFATSSHPEDEVFTIVFNEQVREALPSGEPFTQNQHIVEASLVRYPPGGMTAVYDAVIAGLDHLQQATHQKKVLVVLTDGDDNASHHSRQDMLHRAMRSDALIYTIFTGDLSSTRGDRDVLKRLAAATGGVFYAPDDEAQVVTAFTRIAENIRRGYSIGFVPAHTDDEYHRVKIMVRAPGFKRLSVRARDGYAGLEAHAD